MIVQTVQEFYQFFQKNMPILAIDYGLKKTGMAISTPDHSISMPHGITDIESEKKKVNYILGIIERHNICAIVLGLPVNMDGSNSNQTDLVLKFADYLVKRTNLPIYMQDERLTSKAANQLMQTFGMKRKERNQADDSAAASMILETVLESVKNF